MKTPPPYFEKIRLGARELWDQLDAKPELAGPWHQLFKQVQSPPHVISELLQNAEDAGATQARVEIGAGDFAFAHNGEDFAPEHLQSLCRFGFSNKRALHTIGFRGIGFKSTFSLGDEVRLTTPSLSILFRKKRFTEPVWIDGAAASTETRIEVTFLDGHRKHKIEKTLDTWTQSPASLLFFRSLRQLKLGDQEVAWLTKGPGPVADSEWVSLAGSDNAPILLVRSDLAEFPEECIKEIREERMLGDGDEELLPPCKVEIALGLEGRLFVVLPTGITMSLPFASNGPFIQDPARVKIKDPETSPTNRWLLKRVGALAAKTMLQWLARTDLPLDEQALAYRLLPNWSMTEDSLEHACYEIVSEAFFEALEGKAVLLTNRGQLVTREKCVAVPTWLFDVWEENQISARFDEKHRALLCAAVEADVRTTLVLNELLDQLRAEQVLNVLQHNHLPKPKSWANLLKLWAAVAPHVTKSTMHWEQSWKEIQIVPVQGQLVLYSAGDAVRLGDKRLLRLEGDWDFLSQFLIVMNPNWPRYLGEQRRIAESNQDTELAAEVQAAEGTLQAIGLTESSDATKVMERVAAEFFSRDEIENADCIRLAQIAATLSITASTQFEFVTSGGSRAACTPTKPLIADSQFSIDLFASETWCSEHVLHSDYWSAFQSCTAEEWRQWVASGRSGLFGFIPLQQPHYAFHGETRLNNLLKQRGQNELYLFPYRTENFEVKDWDFPEEHWRYWELQAKSDSEFWGKLVRRIFEQPPTFWSQALIAKVDQVASNGWKKNLDVPAMRSSWIARLREKICLQDTRGMLRQPSELLRRTADTESLLDVEPFVRSEFDTESLRPLLVKLGVKSKPPGPDSLLERLKALSTVVNPPVYEVEKWVRRLDQLLPRCSTDDLREIQDAFHVHRLILTTEGTWATSAEVFLSVDHQAVPGAAIVHETLRDLTIWQRIGVEEHPTLDLILEWLKTLPQEQKLAPEVLRRVKDLLPRHPFRIWSDCGCWLNLEGEWIKTQELRYSISMHSLSSWSHLFPAVKRQVADFIGLSAEVVHDQPFGGIPSLGSCLEERVESNLFSASSAIRLPWLSALGAGLSRLMTDSEEKTARIREEARRLARTMWQTTTSLETVPYLDGTPAGTPRSNDVLWENSTLFVVDRPVTSLLRQIARELSRPFDDLEIADAVKFCIDRSAEHVTKYLEQNFTLEAVQEVASGETATPTGGPCTNLPEFLEDAPSPEQGTLTSGNGSPTESPLDPTNTAVTIEPEPSPSELAQLPPETGESTDARPKSPALIHRFAKLQGFEREANGERYFHSDGRWLQKQGGQAFPWEMYSADGDVLKSLLVRDHYLLGDPLQIAAEVWEAFRREPEKHSLVVTDYKDEPMELSGAKILNLRERGKLALHAATYRLACSDPEGFAEEVVSTHSPSEVSTSSEKSASK